MHQHIQEELQLARPLQEAHWLEAIQLSKMPENFYIERQFRQTSQECPRRSPSTTRSPTQRKRKSNQERYFEKIYGENNTSENVSSWRVWRRYYLWSELTLWNHCRLWHCSKSKHWVAWRTQVRRKIDQWLERYHQRWQLNINSDLTQIVLPCL